MAIAALLFMAAMPSAGWLRAETLPGMTQAQRQAREAADPDHPAGNRNELTLAGLRPGASGLAQALRLFGPGWKHPSRDETDVYQWSDPARGWQLSLEVGDGVVQAVSITDQAVLGVQQQAAPSPSAARGAHLPARAGVTGLGMHLGGTPEQLRRLYGKPFFEGPTSLDGHANLHLIVYNFSWAGADKPQVLESTFDGTKLVKMTLSAEYY